MSNSDSLAHMLAISGLTSILITLVCIALAWMGIQQLRFEQFLKQPKSFGAKVLQIFLAISLGYLVGKFITDYINWSSDLTGIL
ncbi:MAG: DUF1146 domain-containing protein [Gorillibacterium sp.]|nr:DUF1146 domain-containing protein [Gorillibacterium sp.]